MTAVTFSVSLTGITFTSGTPRVLREVSGRSSYAVSE